MFEKISPEYRAYKIVELWEPVQGDILVKNLADPTKKLGKLFAYAYEITKKEYASFPKRKEGQNPIIHPLNVVWDLWRAGINDMVTLSTALTHDLIEEKVDLYKKKKEIKEDQKGIVILDSYENECFLALEQELKTFCSGNKIDLKLIEEIMRLLQMLTRHKRHYYYRSISTIFNYGDEKLKEKAIQIKLADRMHNIQSLDTYNEQGRIYSCFKNLFILNNTKNYLIKKYGKEANPKRDSDPTNLLFKKCSKATYDAYSKVCKLALERGINEVTSILELAFRKFVHEKKGLWAVTALDPKEIHPIRFYQGIVRKYDARLHHEWDKFQRMEKEEKDYARKFFADYKFKEEQLQAILDYKDAYALKEVIARMIYKRNYVIFGFGCTDLCSRKMVCMKI